MLQYQKNTLLNLLLQFESKLYNEVEEAFTRNDFFRIKANPALDTISRNIQSIKKQIKKL